MLHFLKYVHVETENMTHVLLLINEGKCRSYSSIKTLFSDTWSMWTDFEKKKNERICLNRIIFKSHHQLQPFLTATFNITAEEL